MCINLDWKREEGKFYLGDNVSTPDNIIWRIQEDVMQNIAWCLPNDPNHYFNYSGLTIPIHTTQLTYIPVEYEEC